MNLHSFANLLSDLYIRVVCLTGRLGMCWIKWVIVAGDGGVRGVTG